MERQTVTHWEVRRCDLPGDVGVLSWIGASITPGQSARSLLLIAVSAAVSIPASAQVMTQKLLAPDMQPNDYFGSSVALIPGWAFVSKEDDDVQAQSGAIYAYRDTGAGWVNTQKLKASDPAFGAMLGYSLSASGDWMVATTPFDRPQGGYDVPGSAHVYHLQGGTWVHTQKLLASDFTSIHQKFFGWSAALRGDRLVIGERDDHTAGYAAGSAYVFQLQGGSWIEVAKLYAADSEVYGSFGDAVAIDGDRLVVGAPSHDNGGPDINPGAAYVFERQANGTWVQTQKLIASDPGPQNFFGFSVAINGDSILVGAPTHNHTPQLSGVVYAFTRQGGQFVETQELWPWDNQQTDLVGASVQLDSELAVFSAASDGDAAHNSGSAYVFRRVHGAWQQTSKMIPLDGKVGHGFSRSVAISGRHALIGSWGDDEACPTNPGCNSGSAYLFELAPEAVQFCACPSAGPCGNHDKFGGCKTSRGMGGILSASGSSSLSASNLRLQATWLPTQAIGIFLMGGGTAMSPLGDGQLCIGGANIYRFKPGQSAAPFGILEFGANIPKRSIEQFGPTGWITPGSSWNFQAWFRDNQGPCGQGSNLTSAVRVDFLP